MDIETKDGKNPLFLVVNEDPHGDNIVLTFAQAFESEAWDMVAQLPAYLAFLYMEVALEYFTAEATTRARKSPWDDKKMRSFCA